jgi:hypothetical protein
MGLLLRVGAVGKMAERPQSLVEVDDCLPVGRSRHRFVRRLPEVMDRPAPLLTPEKVISQDFVVLGKAVGVQLLDGQTNDAMQLAAAPYKQRVVGDAVGEGVLEHVGQLRKDPALVDQLDGLQLLQELLGPATDVGDPVEEAARELASDDRSQLQGLLGGLLQPVDPRHDHVLDRVGHDDLLDRLRHGVAVARRLDGARFLERAHHFLDEEWVPLGLSDDKGLELLGQGVGGQDGLRHLFPLRGREGIQGEPGMKAPLAQAMHVARPVGDDHQGPAGGHAVGDEGQILFGGGVRPMQVLVDEHVRTYLGGSHGQRADGVEESRPALRRIQIEKTRIAGIDREQEAQMREDRPQVFPEQQHVALDLPDHHLLGVTFLDPEGPPEHVDEGVEGDGTPKGHAVPLEPERLVGQTATKLEEQARLADAGLAGDEDDLSLAAARPLESLGEHV